LAEAAFVAEVIAAGVAASTMRACSRDELISILRLGVAFNSALKRDSSGTVGMSSATC
jgi:hypothetical protein